MLVNCFINVLSNLRQSRPVFYSLLLNFEAFSTICFCSLCKNLGISILEVLTNVAEILSSSILDQAVTNTNISCSYSETCTTLKLKAAKT